MNRCCSTSITNALGDVEDGETKHILVPSVTTKRNAYGLIPTYGAADVAIGTMSMIVAVLLVNMVRSAVM